MDVENIKRPKTYETFEDILKQQEEFYRIAKPQSRQSGVSVSVKKMRRKNDTNLDDGDENSKDDMECGHEDNMEQCEADSASRNLFDCKSGKCTVDVDSIIVECSASFLSDVQERNTEYLDDVTKECCSTIACEEYCKEDGFPEVFDLSNYFGTSDGSKPLRRTVKGKSIFATEFDRLRGLVPSDTSVANDSCGDLVDDAISVENLRRIQLMTNDDISRAQQEIYERFDSGIVEYLRKRGQRLKWEKSDGAASHDAHLIEAIGGKDNFNELENKINGGKSDPIVQEKIGGLEMFSFDPMCSSDGFSESVNFVEENLQEHFRFAAEPQQLDMTAKCYKHVASRQARNLWKLFDSLAFPPNGYDGSDELIEMARSNLKLIKGLFLNEQSKSGSVFYVFNADIDPSTHGSWCLSPIRKVLSAFIEDGQISIEDVIVVRLSLFLCLLLLKEKSSVFHAFINFNHFFVNFAEIFFLGPDVFTDERVSVFIVRIINNYIAPNSFAGHLRLSLIEPIADRKSFLSFFEELMQRFEEFSNGNVAFSTLILIGAYANAEANSALLTKIQLWSVDRNIVRQITMKTSAIEGFTQFLEKQLDKRLSCKLEEEFFVQYAQLLGLYVKAMENAVVTRERNELVYQIAEMELGSLYKEAFEQAGNSLH